MSCGNGCGECKSEGCSTQEIAEPNHDIIRVQPPGMSEVMKITHDGKVFWNGREVETDDDFRGAMIGLRDALMGQLRDNGYSTFQARVNPWLHECFGALVAGDREERNHRFLEESLELVQACGCDRDAAHMLVDYVYDRSVGEKHQEVGGVMVTLAALCLAQGLNMHEAGETELHRIWGKVDAIRAKQATKPKSSPLPGQYPEEL